MKENERVEERKKEYDDGRKYKRGIKKKNDQGKGIVKKEKQESNRGIRQNKRL